MPSHIHTSRLQVDSRLVSGSSTITAGHAQSYDEVIPADTSDEPVNCTIDVSTLKSLFLVSDQAVTVYFTGPNVALALGADVAYRWFFGSGITNPLASADVTGVLVTTGVGDDARLQMEILTDPTP